LPTSIESQAQKQWAEAHKRKLNECIPDNYRVLLENYYTMKLGQISTALNNLQRPQEEVLKEQREESDRLIEEMRARGQFTPRPDSQ